MLYSIPSVPIAPYKEKLAPSNLSWLKDFAIVREIVDFPVPALSFSQIDIFPGETKPSLWFDEGFWCLCQEGTPLHAGLHILKAAP